MGFLRIYKDKICGTGSDHDDQNQQKPRSSYLVVTHQIDNLTNSHIQKKVRVSVLDQLIYLQSNIIME